MSLNNLVFKTPNFVTVNLNGCKKIIITYVINLNGRYMVNSHNDHMFNGQYSQKSASSRFCPEGTPF